MPGATTELSKRYIHMRNNLLATFFFLNALKSFRYVKKQTSKMKRSNKFDINPHVMTVYYE